MRRVAFEADLRAKSFEGDQGLRALQLPKPRLDDCENMPHPLGTLRDPLVVIRFTVALDVTDSTEGLDESDQHRGRAGCVAVLARRRTDPVPRRAICLSRPLGAAEPEASLGVIEDSPTFIARTEPYAPRPSMGPTIAPPSLRSALRSLAAACGVRLAGAAATRRVEVAAPPS